MFTLTSASLHSLSRVQGPSLTPPAAHAKVLTRQPPETQWDKRYRAKTKTQTDQQQLVLMQLSCRALVGSVCGGF